MSRILNILKMYFYFLFLLILINYSFGIEIKIEFDIRIILYLAPILFKVSNNLISLFIYKLTGNCSSMVIICVTYIEIDEYIIIIILGTNKLLKDFNLLILFLFEIKKEFEEVS